PYSSILLSNFLPSFFFNAPSLSEIYTLSLHDALPISKPIFQSITKLLEQIRIDNDFFISILLPIGLFLVMICLFVKFTYILLMNDNSKRNSEKNAIFKEVKTLYNVEKVETDNTDIRTSLEIAIDEAMAPIKLNWLHSISKKVILWVEKKKVIETVKSFV